MEGHHLHQHHHHLHHLQQQHHQQQQQVNNMMMNNVVTVVDVGERGGDGRFPQWSVQETKEFLMIRAELDQTFMETKRNKQLWEVVANRMKDKGYLRSPEQCKCKWKNLVTRYKGCETMESEAVRQQFPFYNELQMILATRMERMMWAEAEGSKKNKALIQNLSSDEEDNDTNNNNELEESDTLNIGGEHKGSTSSNKKKKKKGKNNNNSNYSNNNSNYLKEILERFMRQQMEIEAQWREAYEARERERRMRELEWRQTMEALENEKMMMDQRWREREEQRRVREEARADKRDALITALLNNLTRSQDNM